MTAHFTAEQITALAAPLSRANVAQRAGAGSMKLSYIESHHAIREANRIFGFDGWSSETVDLRVVAEAPTAVSYMARVRITVYAGGRILVREGVGHGHGHGPRIGEAHEKAAKEAESDAQKRALRHFGDQFGLALYDKAQEHVTNDAPAAPEQPAAPTISERASASVVDPKVAALNSMPPKTQRPTQRDSAAVRDAVLLAVRMCDTYEQLVTWGKQNGRQSDKWPLMLPADQKAVLAVAETRLRDVKTEAA